MSPRQGGGALRPSHHGAGPEERTAGGVHRPQQHRLLPEQTQPQADPGSGGQLPAEGQVPVRHHHTGERGGAGGGARGTFPRDPTLPAACISPGHRRRRRASFLASASRAETHRRSVNVCPARLPRLDCALAAAEAAGEQTAEQMANTVWLLVVAAADEEEPERSSPSFKRAETSARSTPSAAAFG